jgi:competence protein CoiA
MIKIPHFAHKPPLSCAYGLGESEQHRACKQSIYTNFLHIYPGIVCELEKNLGTVVPDIYIDPGAGRGICAIEVQRSILSMDTIIRRTSAYAALGISVLWLPLYHDGLAVERYAPRSWEKWLHATYYGRVYYWWKDVSVIPVHFDEYHLYVEETEWYESDGELRNEGGYYRRSKRYRTPRKGLVANIATDFHRISRPPWTAHNIVVPACRLLIDNQPAWWK